MFRRLGHLLLMVALLAAMGAHWNILQTLAWTTMLADNLQHASFTEAVRKTFDGAHPCSLCKQIAVGKKSDKKSEFPPQLKKFEFWLATSRFVFATPTLSWRLGVAERFAIATSLQPPTPPPRLARA